ncbi:UNKNOWN [Stylonychia lemnae]|uniref:Uncharacterized protein n=1 Tax=Stylonychia lemnae TaxID=5949 RepID=A0A077ZTB2_STYLE|nr:UNKNOWN [Stylonychia lemnae]|eukprot:CDW73128.1 UNKNOWN [Stylonychia lemnae]
MLFYCAQQSKELESSDYKICSNLERKQLLQQIQALFSELEIVDYYIKVKSLITLDIILKYSKLGILIPFDISEENFQKMLAIVCVLTSWNEFNNQGDFRFQDAYKVLGLEFSQKNHEQLLISQNKMEDIIIKEYNQDNLIKVNYDLINQYQIQFQANSQVDMNTLSQSQDDSQFFLESEIKDEIFNQFVKGVFIALSTQNIQEIQNNSITQSDLLLRAIKQATVKLLKKVQTQKMNDGNILIFTQSKEEQFYVIIQATQQVYDYFKKKLKNLQIDSSLQRKFANQ